MGKYIMALDQGTTSSRTILFDKKGNIVCQANKEFEQIFPKPGWVEHNPEEIWMTQLLTMEDVMRQAGITGKDIEAIGITNQRETTVIWDKNTGKPIYNAIVWQCRRTSDIVDGLVKDGLRDFIRNKTGLVPDAYFSGTKIKWILDNVPGASTDSVLLIAVVLPFSEYISAPFWYINGVVTPKPFNDALCEIGI